MSGCVYKIYSLSGNCCYIGKTTKPCRKTRFSQHKWEYKRGRYYYTSYEVLKYPDAEFEILEDNIPEWELIQREKEFMRNEENVVNLSGTKYI